MLYYFSLATMTLLLLSCLSDKFSFLTAVKGHMAIFEIFRVRFLHLFVIELFLRVVRIVL